MRDDLKTQNHFFFSEIFEKKYLKLFLPFFGLIWVHIPLEKCVIGVLRWDRVLTMFIGPSNINSVDHELNLSINSGWLLVVVRGNNSNVSRKAAPALWRGNVGRGCERRSNGDGRNGSGSGSRSNGDG